jgi:hypothetical protein
MTLSAPGKQCNGSNLRQPTKWHAHPCNALLHNTHEYNKLSPRSHRSRVIRGRSIMRRARGSISRSDRPMRSSRIRQPPNSHHERSRPTVGSSMNTTAYLIVAQSSDTTTKRAVGESLSRRLFDPSAQQHGFERVLRSKFCPTGPRTVGKPDDNPAGPESRAASLATGPSFLVDCTHTTRIFGSVEPIAGVYPKTCRYHRKDPRLTFGTDRRRFVRVWEGAKARFCRGFVVKVAQSAGEASYATVVCMGGGE